MKTFFLSAGAALSIVVAATLTFDVNNTFFDIDVEALTAAETRCISSSEENTGRCERAVNGTGDVCVKTLLGWRNNCYTHE